MHYEFVYHFGISIAINPMKKLQNLYQMLTEKRVISHYFLAASAINLFYFVNFLS